VTRPMKGINIVPKIALVLKASKRDDTQKRRNTSKNQNR
jgi:hypothetical protein